MRKLSLTLVLLLVTAIRAQAQVGDLIFSEDFDNLNRWIKLTGNGSWGWGNGELEYYSPANVDVAEIPGEPGNHALRIVARHESGAGIVDQWGNPLAYTSGRVMSRSGISVRYGMIETRVRVPDLNLGGWPAVWLLGTSNFSWPSCGEIDLMEMGASKAFRDLHDTHNGGNGLDNSTVNQFVGANAIYYSPGAVNSGNPSGAAGLAYDPSDTFDRPYYAYANPLAGRFLTYRLYWTADSMRFTVVDDGVEHDLYTHPFALTADSDEFRQPFYFLANLAIGGAYTDAGTLGGATTITMPLPATMYVDYIRVYRWNGQGEVTIGPPAPQAGTYGIYTDTTPTQGGLTPGVDAGVYVWSNTLVNGAIAPYEGAHDLTWKTNGQGWFGAGVMAYQPVNLYDFGGGALTFMVKMPANVTFQIGVIDTWGNQNYVTFPANVTTYGLVRDGNWGRATIPVGVLRGAAIDLRMLSYTFVVLEQNGATCEFALDDITWTGGAVPAGVSPPVAGRSGLLAGAPNPFRGGTTLRFELPAAAPYVLGVYDARGARVAHLAGSGRTGGNAVRWDGRRDDGRRVPPGVYLVRLEGSAAAGRRVVLLD